MQALIDANLSGQIVGVISNKPEAYALARAQKAGIQMQSLNTSSIRIVKPLMM